MLGSKTRLWRGGLAEIMGDAAPASGVRERAAQAEPGAPSAKAQRDQAPCAADARRTTPSSAEGARVHDRARTRVGYAVDFALARDQPTLKRLSATRVVPIEELLAPKPADVGAGSGRPSADPASRETPLALPLRKLPLRAAHLRRGLMILLGLFVVTAKLWGQAHEPEARPTLAIVRGDAEPPALPARVAEPQRQPEPAQPAATTSPAQRSAVDALAIGDLAQAQRIYGQLASSVTGPSPYSEAARILARRVAPTR